VRQQPRTQLLDVAREPRAVLGAIVVAQLVGLRLDPVEQVRDLAMVGLTSAMPRR
jgi:hypothetical protein